MRLDDNSHIAYHLFQWEISKYTKALNLGTMRESDNAKRAITMKMCVTSLCDGISREYAL